MPKETNTPPPEGNEPPAETFEDIMQDELGDVDTPPTEGNEPTTPEPTTPEPPPEPPKKKRGRPPKKKTEPEPEPAIDPLFTGGSDDSEWEDNPPEPPPAEEPKAFDELEDEEKAKVVQEDDAVTVDLSKLDDKPKRSIYNLVSQRDGARAKVTDLEKENAELKGQLEGRPTDDRVKELEEQIKAANNRLGYFDVEETPVFKQRVSAPRKEIQDTILMLAESYAVDVETVKRSLSMNPKDRNDLLTEKFPDFMEPARNSFLALDRLSVVERGLREDHPTVLNDYRREVKEHQARTALEVEENQSRRLQFLANRSVTSAASSPVPFFKKVGDKDHDALVDSLLKQGQDLILSGNPEKVSRMAVIGLTAKHYHRRLQAALEINADLENKIAKLKGVKPRREGKSGPPDADAGSGKNPQNINDLVDSVIPD